MPALLPLAALALVATQQSPPVVPQTIDYAKDPTLYLVGYSHLDTEWVWTYRHSILDCIPRTLNENFALFDKYPDYTFNWTGAKRYEFMKEYYPAEYSRLKGYVRAGRWTVTGSGWDECDANVPAPESIIRQVLYSNRFFAREFGVTSNNYLVPDVFGFPASLPSTLAHAGLKGMSTCKLSYYPDTSSPIPFNVGRWIGPNGDSIVGALNAQSYHTQVREDLSASPTMLARMEDQKKKSGLMLDYSYYGVGDEGGSPGEESIKWVEASKRGKGPIRVVAKGADAMFDDLSARQRAALPSYKGELLISKHSAGTATSGATMKRWNHRNELLADAAERAAVAARTLVGTPYPAARMTDAWQRFLGGQMHDILPGTSIPQAYAYAWNDQVIALNESADVVRASVGSVARSMDTRAKGQPVVVYNPLSTDRTDVIETDLATGDRVFGPDGKEVPTQRQGAKLLFLARVPALGFATFDVRDVRSGAAPKAALKVSTAGLENVRYRVHVDANGDVASVWDKSQKRELLAAPARLAFLYQKPMRHPAWNMDWDDQRKPPVGYVDGPAKITVVERGPVRVALRIEREARGSKFVSFVRLTAGGDRVEFGQTIDWRSSECSLKAVFPLTAQNPKATYDCGIGTVQRGNNAEKQYEGPSQRWFDLTDKSAKFGASILSEAKYGSDKPTDDTLRLTLLYTPGVRDNYQHQSTSDWGRHEITYALMGHMGDWQAGRTPDAAARLNQPLMAFAVPAHPGLLGRQLAFVRSSAANVGVMAMKAAEDGDETIVRVLERHGVGTPNVRLTFARPVLSIREVDGQERAKPGVVGLRNGAPTFEMTPFAVRAFAVRFAPVAPNMTSQAVDLPFDIDVISRSTGETDGDFDGTGKSLPGDLLPSVIESGGVPFTIATSTGRNALRCAGQTIEVPAGRRLYVVAASMDGDRPGTFIVDGKPHPLTIQSWDGFVGQWDTRRWEGATSDEKTFGWNHRLLGITPGYIKRAPIAWYADHRRLADGTNDAYRFCQLTRYVIDLPVGAARLTLPNDPKIVLLALTVADAPGDDARPLHPLYDTLEGHPEWTAP